MDLLGDCNSCLDVSLIISIEDNLILLRPPSILGVAAGASLRGDEDSFLEFLELPPRSRDIRFARVTFLQRTKDGTLSVLHLILRKGDVCQGSPEVRGIYAWKSVFCLYQ